MLVNRRFLDGFDELQAKIDALGANDNSNISELETRVSLLEASNPDNNSDTSDLEVRVAILEASGNNENSSLNEEINEIKADLIALRNDFDTLTSG